MPKPYRNLRQLKTDLAVTQSRSIKARSILSRGSFSTSRLLLVLSPAEHYLGAPTLSDINAFKNKQVKRVKEVYKMIPDRLVECLPGNIQQHVTRFIFSQPWELSNQESLRWMLALKSIVNELFHSIPLVTSGSTTAETPSTFAVFYSIAPCCLADILPIEAALLPLTAKSCSAMPSDCSAADIVPDPDFS